MRNATARQLSEDLGEQQSKLLPALFPHPEDCERLTVLHIGPAVQDTLDFFAAYRCQLHIRDLFAELPLPARGRDILASPRTRGSAPAPGCNPV